MQNTTTNAATSTEPMKYQQRPYWCGPASIQSALRCYGVRVGQGRIAKLCGTTADGTDDEEMLRGILALGYEADPYNTDVWNEAINWLDNKMMLGTPVLLCIDSWEHWVCIVGSLGYQGAMRYCIFDPARFNHNIGENGLPGS